MIPVLNEKKYIEEIMELSSLPKTMSPNAMISYLTKYYYSEDLDFDTISELVCSQMNKFNLDITVYQEYKAKIRIQKVYNAIINEKTFLLKDYNNIPLYKSEYEKIMSCESDREKKVLFIIYIMARYTNKYGWVYLPECDIYKMANVSTTVKNKEDIISKLLRDGKIKDTKKVDDLKIGVELSDGNDEVELEVETFNSLGNQFMAHIKPGYILCQECGKLVKLKSKHDGASKYCSKCSKHVDKENKKILMKNLRAGKKHV